MKVSKKLFMMVVLLLAGFVLVACGETTTEATTAAPTTEAPVTTVAPTTTETPVTTAAPTLAELIADLEEFYTYTLGDDDYIVVEDISLLGTIGGVAITWSSSDTTLVEDNGVIHKPTFTDGNQTAVLTATITVGDESLSTDFFATVAAAAKTDQERADEAFMTVTIFPAKEFWTSLDNDILIFANTATDDDDVDYAVTWTSSHPTVITPEGVIIQPDGAAQLVTMTASITIDDVEFTKDVSFNIAASPVADVTVSTIAEALALIDSESYVKITGMTVVGVEEDNSAYFTDGVDILFAYQPGYVAEVGKVYDMYGFVENFYNAPEFMGTDEFPLYAIPSLAPASDLPVTVAEDIFDILDNTSQPAVDNLFENVAYTVTANVYYNADFSGNYSVFLVPTDFDYDADLEDGAILPTSNSIMIYYKSDMDVLKAFHGQSVTIDIIMHGWRSDKIVYYADFFGAEEDVEFFFETNAERLQAALNKVDLPKYVLEDTTLDLSTSEFGADLTYASDNAIIDATTGEVDLTGVTTETDVTITVTASYGGETATRDIVVPVGEPALGTIADALAGSKGYLFKVQGTVVAGGYYNTYFIQDATDNVAIYTYDSAMQATLEANVGNVVEVLGVRAAFGGLEELEPVSVTYVQDGTAVTATNIDLMALDSTGLAGRQGELVELTGMVVTDFYENSYGSITVSLLRVSDQEEIELRFDSRFTTLPTAVDDALNALVVGDKVDIITPLGWYNGPQLLVTTTTTFVESSLSDADAALLDAYLLTYGGTLYAGTTITLPATGTFGSTITWAITTDAGASADITSGVLTLTRPAVDGTVVITATVTKVGAVETKDFTFNLVALTDLADAAAEDGNIVVVQGDVYSVLESGFFIQDATGFLFVYADDDAFPYLAGDKVELVGEIDIYNGLVQLVDVVNYAAAISTGNDVTQTPVAYDPADAGLVNGQTYTIAGTIAIEGSYDNVYIYVNATDKIVIYYNSPELSITSLEDMVGQAVEIDAVYYWTSYGDKAFAFTGIAGDLDAVTDFTTLSANDGTNWTIADGEEVYIQGVISGIDGSNVYIQDAAGAGFSLYKPETYDSTLTVGDEVILYGALATYNDNRQISNASLIQKVSTGNDVIVLDYTLAELVGLTVENAGTTISATGLVFFDDNYYGSYLFQSTDGTNTINLRMYSDQVPSWFTDLYSETDVLPEVTFIYTGLNSYGDNMINFVIVSMSEQDKFDVDYASLPDSFNFVEDLVIEDGEFGTSYEVISITGDAAAYLDFTTTAGSILFTEPATDMTGEVVIRATLGSITLDKTISVIAKAPIPDGTVFTETFTNINLSASSSTYSAGSFVGDNDITWSYTESRGDFDLTGRAILLDKDGDGSSLSATVLGGIDEFSVEFYDAFSGAAQVELWINGVLIETSVSIDYDDGVTTTEVFTVTGIAIEGEFDILILAAGAQMVLDNLTWTSYSPAA